MCSLEIRKTRGGLEETAENQNTRDAGLPFPEPINDDYGSHLRSYNSVEAHNNYTA